MKNFILLMIALLGFASYSQTAMKGSSGATSDTVTNAGTEYVYVNTTANVSAYSLQFVGTKISGTVAGTVTLEVSVDGTNYVSIDTSATLKKGTDSYTNTNVTTNTFVWTVTKPAFLWYRFKVVGSGTMVQRIQGYIVGKKEYE